MSNHNKWSPADKIRLVNKIDKWESERFPFLECDFVPILNEMFERSLTRGTWINRIRKTRAEMATVATGLEGCSVTFDGTEVTITSTDTAPDRCDNCKHWNFIWHLADEDREIYQTVGECRIRSVAADCFPERNDNEFCGEYVRKEGE